MLLAASFQSYLLNNCQGGIAQCASRHPPTFQTRSRAEWALRAVPLLLPRQLQMNTCDQNTTLPHLSHTCLNFIGLVLNSEKMPYVDYCSHNPHRHGHGVVCFVFLMLTFSEPWVGLALGLVHIHLVTMLVGMFSLEPRRLRARYESTFQIFERGGAGTVHKQHRVQDMS